MMPLTQRLGETQGARGLGFTSFGAELRGGHGPAGCGVQGGLSVSRCHLRELAVDPTLSHTTERVCRGHQLCIPWGSDAPLSGDPATSSPLEPLSWMVLAWRTPLSF